MGIWRKTPSHRSNKPRQVRFDLIEAYRKMLMYTEFIQINSLLWEIRCLCAINGRAKTDNYYFSLPALNKHINKSQLEVMRWIYFWRRVKNNQIYGNKFLSD